MAHRWNLWSGSLGIGGKAMFTESSCPGLAHGNFLSFSGRTRQRCFEIGDSRLCTGAFHKPTTGEIHWRKWIGAAELEWAKMYGGILYNKWYLLDIDDTNPENPKRLLLRPWHGQYQNFRVYGTAWTFSGTICVNPCGDEPCDLVEFARVKFMDAQAARDLPPAIQYQSVHCDISPLVLSSGSEEVKKVPVRGFLQSATTSWNSKWER